MNVKKGRPKTIVYADRKCVMCSVIKPIHSFHKCKSYPGGHTYICMTCNGDVAVLKRFKKLLNDDVETAMQSFDREVKLNHFKKMIIEGIAIKDIIKTKIF